MPTSSSKPAVDQSAEILCREILETQTVHAPDYAAENACLLRLVRALRDAPRDILTVLANTALEVCCAGSAGISILETPPGRAPQFRWQALAGAWTPYLGAVMPLTGSPSLEVLDRNELQLVCEPLREFPCFRGFRPDCRQALCAPFYLGGVPVGTLWVVKHERRHHFDSEDARVLTHLADFASAAYQTLQSMQVLEAQSDARRGEIARLISADRSKDAFIATIGCIWRGNW
jgi:GAF domain-containing protein